MVVPSLTGDGAGFTTPPATADYAPYLGRGHCVINSTSTADLPSLRAALLEVSCLDYWAWVAFEFLELRS